MSKRPCGSAKALGLRWGSHWANNHSELRKKRPQYVDVTRLDATSPDKIRSWFDQISREIEKIKVPPSLIFNMDETMIESRPSRSYVWVPREYEAVKKHAELNGSLHITLVFCISASGGHVKPLAILPMKNFPGSLAPLIDAFHWCGQDNGWMIEELFQEWVIDIFIPHVKSVRSSLNQDEKAPALLYLDGHSSRQCPDALSALKRENITAITIPAHTSHVLQPLDCGVNRSFKEKFRALKSRSQAMDLPNRRLQLLTAAHKSHYESMYCETIISAWKTSGLYPWNVEAALASKYVSISDTRELNIDAPKRHRSYFNISGKVITADNCIEQVTRIKSAKRAKQSDLKESQKRRKKQLEIANDIVFQNVPVATIRSNDAVDISLQIDE